MHHRLHDTEPEQAAGHTGRRDSVPVPLLHLQRSVGNQATTALVQALSSAPATGPQALQRQHSEELRGAKHRRTTIARREIPLLAATVSQQLKDHLFKGAPLEGGDVDKDDPVGMHAYGQAGTLPAGMVKVVRRGSPGQVHEMAWRWDGTKQGKQNKPEPYPKKESTMFPQWMPPLHVLALVALRLGQRSANNEMVQKYIERGHTINLDGKGGNVWPIL